MRNQTAGLATQHADIFGARYQARCVRIRGRVTEQELHIWMPRRPQTLDHLGEIVLRVLNRHDDAERYRGIQWLPLMRRRAFRNAR